MTLSTDFLITLGIAMVPVIELRGAIPIGVSLGLHYLPALIAAILGNMFPIPFIIVYIRRIFHWMRQWSPRFDGLVSALERRAHLKGRLVTKYRFWGLLLFVAIPLPGTGAWTGALIAALLDMRLREALPAIFCGVVVAGFAVLFLTFGVVNILA